MPLARDETPQDKVAAQAALFALAYEELKRVARRARRDAHVAETIDTTALVHEAFLKIRVRDEARDEDPTYLRALAARAMRQILVDRARRRLADKRGQGALHVTLSAVDASSDAAPIDLVSVERALVELERLDARLARLVEMHVFGGMSMPEVASVLAVTERTAFRDWRKARAFLVGHLGTTGIA
jgi:RNA polymerase sigma factor (TIGR02999 family)